MRATGAAARRNEWLVKHEMDGIAVLDVGLPNIAKEFVYAEEVAIAFCDARPALCWTVEAQEHWGPGSSAIDEHRHANTGHGLSASHVAGQLRSAVAGLRVFSSSSGYDAAWLRRLYSACGQELDFEVHDLSNLTLPFRARRKHPCVDVDKAIDWSDYAVPVNERSVTVAARTAALIRELSRMAKS